MSRPARPSWVYTAWVALVLVVLSIVPVWLAQRISGGEAARGGRF